MTLPGFSAMCSLPSNPQPWRGAVYPLEAGEVRPAQNPALDGCLEGCTALPPGWVNACVIACWAKYAFDAYGESPTGPTTGPPDFPEYGPVEAEGTAYGWLAGATLLGIAIGTFAGYEIEKHGTFAPTPPKAGIPTPTCGFTTPGAPKTQHSITATSRLGCARSEGLAIQAADADCKARTGLCSGPCTTGTCAPYAHVWNTATVTGVSGWTGFGGIDIFSSVVNGCSTTAYYTCECGC